MMSHLSELRQIRRVAFLWAIFWTLLFAGCFSYVLSLIFYVFAKLFNRGSRPSSNIAFLSFFLALLFGMTFGFINSSQHVSQSTLFVLNSRVLTSENSYSYRDMTKALRNHFASIEFMKNKYLANKSSLPDDRAWYLFGWDAAQLVNYELQVNSEIANEMISIFEITEKLRAYHKKFCPK
jgi:ABC-type transport system involved in multi-copper enzyme maturation permease subunit